MAITGIMKIPGLLYSGAHIYSDREASEKSVIQGICIHFENNLTITGSKISPKLRGTEMRNFIHGLIKGSSWREILIVDVIIRHKISDERTTVRGRALVKILIGTMLMVLGLKGTTYKRSGRIVSSTQDVVVPYISRGTVQVDPENISSNTLHHTAIIGYKHLSGGTKGITERRTSETTFDNAEQFKEASK